jgi:hydrophobe/amphiphile efflux-1 (HAE1) family protein
MFIELFIKRPVLSLVFSMLILMLGIKAFDSLSVRQFPEVTYPVVKVTTVYPGASQDLVKGFITVPIQNAIASADGIAYMSSVSTDGVSTIMAYLQSGYDVNVAAQDISIKVNARRGQLPAEAEDPVVTKENTVGSGTLQYLAFSSETMTEERITDYLRKVVQPVISTIEGVGDAPISGSKTFAMRVWLDSVKMAAHQVTALDVDEALRRDNVQSSAGTLKGEFVSYNVDAKTGLETPEQFAQIVVKNTGGVLVHLSDVARVELGAESYDSAISFSGKTAIFIKTAAATNANPLDVAARVRAKLPMIRAQLPDDMELDLVFDTTFAIQRSIDEVARTILEASAIVVLVIFLFLGSFRSVVIPVVTIPLSLIGVLSFMLLMGFSINLLTLLAMVLAIGLVVDDAIVVVENIQRHIENGLGVLAAAQKGAVEIARPVISMTITLAAVYAPLGFMEGMTGTLFTEFAYTLAGAVIVSGVIALTLSPMMCASLLRPLDNTSKPNTVVSLLNRSINRLQSWYVKVLSNSMVHYPVTVVFALMILVSTYFLYQQSKHELAPAEDLGVVFVIGSAPQYANIDYMKKYAAQAEQIINSVPERKESFIMQGIPEPTRLLSLVILDDWADRERSAKQVQDALMDELRKVSGLQMYGFSLSPVPSGATGLPVQLAIKSTESDARILEVAEKIKLEAMKSGKFAYAAIDLKFSKPQLEIDINRKMASELGVDMGDIGRTLAILLGENYTNRFSYEGHSYKVIPQAERSFRFNPELLNRYYVRTHTEKMVSLDTLVSTRMVTTANKLTQFQQLNATFVGALPAPGVTIGEAVALLDDLSARHLPPGFSHDYMGESRQFLDEGNRLQVIFVFSVLLIYLVLAAQFESFKDPLIVLVSVPMSIFGALIPLALGVVSFNIYTQIGMITLIGLISKHGILIVDFANQLQRQGMSAAEAVTQAAAVRLRPILMTTAAMVFGVVPLLVAEGAGSASRFHIGLVIVTGMTVGTLFTLFVVPVFYRLISGKKSEQEAVTPR